MSTPAFYDDIERITNQNTCFRHVVATTSTMQLVVMSLDPKQDIGMEVHPSTTQFIRIESGVGVAIISGKSYALAADMALVIPPNTEHNIINTSPYIPLKLYTLYSPPEHPPDRVNIFKP